MVLVPQLPELLLGSADLDAIQQHLHEETSKRLNTGDFSGRYLHYGIREMGMAAAMNGLSAHGGFVPAGGTFLCFTDYARPSMRIAALSHAHVIYVMTHESIGLGEDGPTHQTVEHLRCFAERRRTCACSVLRTLSATARMLATRAGARQGPDGSCTVATKSSAAAYQR